MMTTSFPDGFIEIFDNAAFNVKQVEEDKFEIWFATHSNLKPYIFIADANKLKVFANNLLEAANRAGSHVG